MIVQMGLSISYLPFQYEKQDFIQGIMHNLNQLLICLLFRLSCSQRPHLITLKVTASFIVKGNGNINRFLAHYLHF